MHPLRRIGLILFLMLLAVPAVPALAQIPYGTTPNWASAESDAYGTGCDLGDIDGDGWLDLAVSNGNDMAASPNYIYLNNMGVLPTTATWVSDNAQYSGHCQLADIDSDGFPELMVTNYISAGWQPGSLQIYDNHEGVLETTPGWEADAGLYSFRATFGDPDGDGDLDLAVATGESYHGIYRSNLVFFNVGGTLETTPGWVSADEDASYDVQFVDIDQDGDQDLALLTASGPVKIYYNQDGVLDSLPGWQTDNPDNGNTFDFADANGDGWKDLAVANNTQLGGSGRFAVFYSVQGVLPTQPDWTSQWSGYGSAANFADMDGDGDQDLVTGGWWAEVSVYLNDNGVFPVVPDWQSDPAPVVENIVFGDLDRGGEFPRQRDFQGDGLTRLLDLGQRHLQGVDRVVVNGNDLPNSAYCYDTQAGWVSLADAPTGPISVYYRGSRENDMVVSDWGGSTIAFFHDGLTPVPGTTTLPVTALPTRAYPNPFNPRLMVEYTLPRALPVVLDVMDLRGHRVAHLDQGFQGEGDHQLSWTPRSLPSGEYLYRLSAGALIHTGKVHLAK